MASVTDDVGLEGSKALPSWLKPTLFLQADFNAEEYVSYLRRSVPLETLSSELQKYVTVLKGKLVEVINEDYNDFVSLSTKLVNVDGVVTQMQKPLLSLKDQLLAAQAVVQAELDALNQGLQKRQQAGKIKALLELMQDTAHVMSKVEKLLAEVDALERQQVGDSLTPEALDTRTRLYERVASEVSRLKYFLAKGQRLPSLQQLQPRADSAIRRLSLLLRQALDAALRGGHQSAVLHCLQAYAAVGDAAAAEQVVQEALVMPLVESIIAQQQASKGPGSAPASDDLAPVLDALLAQVQEHCSWLLEATMALQSGLQSFNFLGNSILAAVDQQVSSSMPGAFSPGVPTSFLSNYRAAMHFLEQLEGMCTTRSTFQALRDSTAYDSFLKRWKLSVYFSLRFQETAAPLESSVAAAELMQVASDQQKDNSLQLCLQPSQALWHALDRCLADGVYLPPLADKFARLVLQLMARYALWLAEAVSARRTASAAGPTQDPAAALAQGSSAWGSRASPEQFALARADLDRLLAWTQDTLWPRLQQRLQSLPSYAMQSTGCSFQEGRNSLIAQAAPLKEAIVDVLVDRCLTVLRQLRGISATYRMTARPLPTRPSHYASGVLQPLRAFLDTDAGKRLQPSTQEELAQGVVANVSQHYASMVSELLDMLQKTEQSLARVRRNKPADAAAAADGSEMSNIQKISLQLSLDTQEYGTQIKKFGLQPSDMDQYQALWRTVAPEDRQNDLSSIQQ